MKKSIVKRFISILLVLVMVFTCCISASAYQEGETKVQVNNWGVEVYLSKSTVQCLGVGISVGGIWVPEPIVSKILSTMGVVISTCPGGIVLEYPYLHMVLGHLNPKSSRWQ